MRFNRDTETIWGLILLPPIYAVAWFLEWWRGKTEDGE